MMEFAFIFLRCLRRQVNISTARKWSLKNPLINRAVAFGAAHHGHAFTVCVADGSFTHAARSGNPAVLLSLPLTSLPWVFGKITLYVSPRRVLSVGILEGWTGLLLCKWVPWDGLYGSHLGKVYKREIPEIAPRKSYPTHLGRGLEIRSLKNPPSP